MQQGCPELLSFLEDAHARLGDIIDEYADKALRKKDDKDAFFYLGVGSGVERAKTLTFNSQLCARLRAVCGEGVDDHFLCKEIRLEEKEREESEE